MRVRQYEADYLDLILRQLTTFITFYFSFENTIAFKLFAKCKGDNNQSYSYKNWFSHVIWLTYNFNYFTVMSHERSSRFKSVIFQIFLDLLLISSKFGPESDSSFFSTFPLGTFLSLGPRTRVCTRAPANGLWRPCESCRQQRGNRVEPFETPIQLDFDNS